MSQEKFDKAVAIVQGLPKDGPIQPSIDEKLVVRSSLPIELHLLNICV